MVTRIFRLLLLISPITIASNINMDMFDIIFFRTGIIFLFMASLFDKPKREIPEYINKIVLGLMGLIMFNLFVHTFAPAVLAFNMTLSLAIIGFYVVYRYIDSDANFTKPIIIAMLINILFYLCQKIGFDFAYNVVPDSGHFGAFLGNTARLSIYLALIAPLISFLFFPLLLFIGYLTGQYTMIIPIILCLFFRSKSNKIKFLIFILSIIIILIMRNFIMREFMIRINDAWFPVLKLLFERPLIGFGLGVNPPVSGLGVMLSSYLQFISGVGILGLVWFCYTVSSLYKNMVKSLYMLPLLNLLLIMTIEYPIEIPRCWYLIIAILITGLIKQKKVYNYVNT